MKLYLPTSALVLKHVYFIEMDAYNKRGNEVCLLYYLMYVLLTHYKGDNLVLH